jgi:hypothetical protein
LKGRSSLSKELSFSHSEGTSTSIDHRNLNERVTRSSRSAHLSCFTNTMFVALFESRDVGHTLSDLS